MARKTKEIKNQAAEFFMRRLAKNDPIPLEKPRKTLRQRFEHPDTMPEKTWATPQTVFDKQLSLLVTRLTARKENQNISLWSVEDPRDPEYQVYFVLATKERSFRFLLVDSLGSIEPLGNTAQCIQVWQSLTNPAFACMNDLALEEEMVLRLRQDAPPSTPYERLLRFAQIDRTLSMSQQQYLIQHSQEHFDGFLAFVQEGIIIGSQENR